MHYNHLFQSIVMLIVKKYNTIILYSKTSGFMNISFHSWPTINVAFQGRYTWNVHFTPMLHEIVD